MQRKHIVRMQRKHAGRMQRKHAVRMQRKHIVRMQRKHVVGMQMKKGKGIGWTAELGSSPPGQGSSITAADLNKLECKTFVLVANQLNYVRETTS
ncbi:hypothetical protein RRG08_000678 [Elysia crispata]|uniref:Uncharacterized protein n=1 Tax=Elysia crispata TaxID=231223 RepID=A0AAE1ARS6_9GAST|nr:hypothetical protein RRG08_000678 [Elysia crispata]